jgi:hypothetical protein
MKKFFNVLGMIGRGILLFFYIIYVFIRMGVELQWCRFFNKERYYILRKELDDF